MSVEIMVKCKNELLLKIGTPPGLCLHDVVDHKQGKSDTPLHSFNMAERGRKRATVGEVLETVFADKDSDYENFDCLSSVSFI